MVPVDARGKAVPNRMEVSSADHSARERSTDTRARSVTWSECLDAGNAPREEHVVFRTLAEPHHIVEVRPSLLTTTLGIDAGVGLFAKVDLSAHCVIGEYHGPVVPHGGYGAPVYDDTYTLALARPARQIRGAPVPFAVTTILGDPAACLVTRANSIVERNAVALRQRLGRDFHINALIMSGDDLATVLGPAYATERVAGLGVPGPEGALFACARCFLVTLHPVAANDEIFALYGEEHRIR